MQHFKLKTNKKGKEQLKFEGTLEELQDLVKLVLDLEGTWKKGIKEKSLHVFQSKKSTAMVSWWSSTSTLTVAGKKEGDINRKIHCLMMLNDSQNLKSVPKPGGSGELLSNKFDILRPRNYYTDNSVDCETQNMAFIQQDDTLPIIREDNTTDPQIQKEIDSIWQELHQVRLSLDHSNNNLVTVMLDIERREMENLCCLLQSKDREIVELRSDLLVKEKLIMQLEIDKEKLMSQLEDCNREPWKQPKKAAKQ